MRDDLTEGRTLTLGFLATWMYEFASVEQGAILQNLAPMTAALGIGGFPHLASHPFAWFQALGFRMTETPFSRTIGAGPITTGLLRVLKKDIPMPTATSSSQPRYQI